jgi:putative ABC transport system permease protein
MQRIFVAAEVALALVLVFGGVLLVDSFLRLTEVEPGFESEGLMTLRITLPLERYGRGAIVDFFSELESRLEARPEVVSAAVSSQIPPMVFSRSRFVPEGVSVGEESSLPWAYLTAVSPDYFRTLGVPLVRGSGFDGNETPESPLRAVINQVVADRYYPDGDPVGQRFKVGSDPEEPWVTIVGVVAATRNLGLESAEAPEIFGSVRQGLGGNQLFVVARSELPSASVAGIVREVVRELDPEQTIYAVQSMEEAFGKATAPRRFATLLVLFFGAFALLLAGVGIYAVVSSSVWERTREIGVRLALGAESQRLRGWVVAQAMLPVAAGAGFGLLGIWVLRGLLTHIAFRVEGLDPWSVATATGILVAVALAASWLPAWRASRIDPVEALRAD